MSALAVIPSPDREMVIQILRDALADAENGGVVACMVVTLAAAGVTRGAWGGTVSFHEKLGLLEQMKHRMLSACEPAES